MKTTGGFLISRIGQVQRRVFQKMLKDSGIEAFNGPQGRILYVLWEHPRLTISEIARQTSLAKPTLTSMLDRMEQGGLVRRIPDSENRRQVFVEMTPQASEYRASYGAVSQRMNQLFYQGFSQEEVRQFESMLLRILENVKEGT